MDEGGYVRVYRRVLEHPEFQDQAEALCFVWLIMKAAWRPTKVRYKERMIELQRGQLALSVRDFANAMGRSKDWAARFLNRTTNRDMTATATATGVNVITICNYDVYQLSPEEAATLNGHQPRHARDRTATQNKEGNKGKEGSSVANATGAEPPNPEKVMWRSGVDYLVAHGMAESSARSILGKWKGRYGTPAVIEALGVAHSESTPDPKAFIEGVLRNGHRQPLGRHQSPDGLSSTTRAALAVFGTCDEQGVSGRADSLPRLGGPCGDGRSRPG